MVFLWGQETFDNLKFFSYQNLGNSPSMLKNYIKNNLSLIFVLKQYFAFYKTVYNFSQFF